ncbi:MAG: hypothetical protein K8823_1556 [Cenarchaeum symbiont of Oopsacas minuta]|nr:hypothetical protein [Cenarchaeum symbiont of Oopsacas minuta]
MPIEPSDMQFLLSGGATNDNPNASIGGAISNVEIKQAIDDLIGNMFDTVYGEENEAGYEDVRIIYLKNNASIMAERCKIFFATPSIDVEIPNPNPELPPEPVVADYPYDNGKVGYITMGIKEGVNVQVPTRISKTDVPTDVNFSQPIRTSKTDPSVPAGALELGNLPAGQYRGIYLKRYILQQPVKNVATFSITGVSSSGE